MNDHLLAFFVLLIIGENETSWYLLDNDWDVSSNKFGKYSSYKTVVPLLNNGYYI